VAGRRFSGLILDFAGVLTTNMVEVIDLFEAREHVRPGAFLSAWASGEGQELYRRLELGLISQQDWNEGFAGLLGISAGNLMGRLLYFLDPAHDVLKVARKARAAGIRTAVLSNSLGHEPHDPYARYDLPGLVDVVVMSDECGLRKPDPAIFQLTLDKLALPASACVFADDTEANLSLRADLLLSGQCWPAVQPEGVVAGVGEQAVRMYLTTTSGRSLRSCQPISLHLPGPPLTVLRSAGRR
jgi:putative hydrolase of the HAD superfamily